MKKLRECRLVDSEKDVDLREYEQEILTIIEETVPNKNQVVYKDRFVTDGLTHGQAIAIGRALAKQSSLKVYSKKVTTYRLFDGRTIEVEDEEEPKEVKGGRVRKQ